MHRQVSLQWQSFPVSGRVPEVIKLLHRNIFPYLKKVAVVLIGNKTAEHTERKQNQRDIVTFKDKVKLFMVCAW